MWEMSDSTHCQIFDLKTFPSSIAAGFPRRRCLLHVHRCFQVPADLAARFSYRVFVATVASHMRLALRVIVASLCRLCPVLSPFGDSHTALSNQ